MKLIPKIFLGIVGTGATIAAITIINPFGIASNIPGLQQARYGYITAATIAGIDPKTIASEEDICLASNLFSHTAIYEWHDEPQYVGVLYNFFSDVVGDNQYEETYKNCVEWLPSNANYLRHDSTEQPTIFSNSNEYIMWHDEYTFEEYYNRSDKTKMTDGAKVRYEEWKRKNGKE